MRKVSLYAVGRALAHATKRYVSAGTGFNRNLTLHWLGPHYNEANLLMALLLIAGLSAEVENLLHEPDPQLAYAIGPPASAEFRRSAGPDLGQDARPDPPPGSSGAGA